MQLAAPDIMVIRGHGALWVERLLVKVVEIPINGALMYLCLKVKHMLFVLATGRNLCRAILLIFPPQLQIFMIT